MEITDYELYHVPPGWTHLKLVTDDTISEATIVKVVDGNETG